MTDWLRILKEVRQQKRARARAIQQKRKRHRKPKKNRKPRRTEFDYEERHLDSIAEELRRARRTPSDA